MKDYSEYEHTSKSGRPFSNSTDWEIWSHNVCQGAGNPDRHCVNDDEDAGGCPLILLAMVDRTPAEWIGPRGRYRCTEKTTAAEIRRAAKQARAAADKAALEAEHYPLLPEVSQ